MRERRMLVLLLVAAALLVLVGAALLTFVPVTFGWFAYAPLSEQTFTFSAGVYLLSPGRAWGLACAVAGLLLATGVAGWALGRRSAARAGGRGDHPPE